MTLDLLFLTIKWRKVFNIIGVSWGMATPAGDAVTSVVLTERQRAHLGSLQEASSAPGTLEHGKVTHDVPANPKTDAADRAVMPPP